MILTTGVADDGNERTGKSVIWVLLIIFFNFTSSLKSAPISSLSSRI